MVLSTTGWQVYWARAGHAWGPPWHKLPPSTSKGKPAKELERGNINLINFPNFSKPTCTILFFFCFGYLALVLAAFLESSVFLLLYTTAACSINLQLCLSKTVTEQIEQFIKGHFNLCKVIISGKLNLFSLLLVFFFSSIFWIAPSLVNFL